MRTCLRGHVCVAVLLTCLRGHPMCLSIEQGSEPQTRVSVAVTRVYLNSKSLSDIFVFFYFLLPPRPHNAILNYSNIIYFAITWHLKVWRKGKHTLHLLHPSYATVSSALLSPADVVLASSAWAFLTAAAVTALATTPLWMVGKWSSRRRLEADRFALSDSGSRCHFACDNCMDRLTARSCWPRTHTLYKLAASLNRVALWIAVSITRCRQFHYCQSTAQRNFFRKTQIPVLRMLSDIFTISFWSHVFFSRRFSS